MRLHRRPAAIVLFAALATGSTAGAQGTGADLDGHPTLNGFTIFAAWNPAAGSAMSAGPSGEAHPNLNGWDYRVNLPFTNLRLASSGARSSAAMVGVIEDTTYAAQTLAEAHHVNNAIWAFAVDQAGAIRFKVFPSRRAVDSAAVTNATSFSGWTAFGPSGAIFAAEKPAAAVVGDGLGTAIITVAARSTDGRILITTRVVDSTSITSWGAAWTEIAADATGAPAAAAAFGDHVQVAWPAADGNIHIRDTIPAIGNISPVVQTVPQGSNPVLVWDGVALNLIFVGPIFEQKARHAYALTPSGYSAPVSISDHVLNRSCDATVFNHRLHVACERLDGTYRVWYATTSTPPGLPAVWLPPERVGLENHGEPQIGAVGDEIYVVGSQVGTGRLQYARRDPHRLPGWIPLPWLSDPWLERGADVDAAQSASLHHPELLAFNNDLYLGADATGGGLHLVNFSRAALKRLITVRHGMTLAWGSDDGKRIIEGGSDPIASRGGFMRLADPNADGRADLVRAAPGGELRVALASSDGSSFEPSTVWRTSFAQLGDQLLAGDVDGDGYDDIVRFYSSSGLWNAQVLFSNGGAGVRSSITWRPAGFTYASSTRVLLGDVSGDGRADAVFVNRISVPGTVLVARGTGTGFGSPAAWHSAMAATGDRPMLADLDGDGTQDLVVAGPSGGAVHAALSTGESFGTRTTWMASLPSTCDHLAAADFNQDRKGDLLCFETGGEVLAAFAGTASFGSPTTLLTTFLGDGDIPLVGNDGDTKGDYTRVAADREIPLTDLYRFDTGDGSLHRHVTMSSTPAPSGAPFERYRFFTEKGLGFAMFPEWIFDQPCILAGDELRLLGASGSGGAGRVQTSVKPGGAQGHILEELGHALFDRCFGTGDRDRFGMHADIFLTPIADGGFEAMNITGTCYQADDDEDLERRPGVPAWIDCRDPEHYFLGFMKTYRKEGDTIRDSILFETNASWRARWQAQYDWLRANWFQGVEYYRDPAPADGRRETLGLQCLPGMCH